MQNDGITKLVAVHFRGTLDDDIYVQAVPGYLNLEKDKALEIFICSKFLGTITLHNYRFTFI